jgi:uncharacterized protein (DUF4415 family)
MPKLKRRTILPTREEDQSITAAALADPDAAAHTDAQWKAVRSQARRGRPPSAVTKERITIRLSAEVVAAFRASGSGWQTRVDTALKEWLRNHSPV